MEMMVQREEGLLNSGERGDAEEIRKRLDRGEERGGIQRKSWK